MAGELIYADLNIPGATSSSRSPQRSQHLSSPPRPRRLHIAVGVGWAGTIILMMAVIALGFWVSKLHISCDRWTRGALNTTENEEIRVVSSTESSSHLGDFRSHMRSILCEPHHGSLAEVSACKLCPTNWLLYRDKCYWVSKEKKSWNRSREDCSKQRASMLMIQDQEEMTFIQTATKDAIWIWLGLTITSEQTKRWEDGSLLNQTLFKVVDPPEGNCCGAIKADQIHFETCSAVSKWICEKDALLI